MEMEWIRENRVREEIIWCYTYAGCSILEPVSRKALLGKVQRDSLWVNLPSMLTDILVDSSGCHHILPLPEKPHVFTI